MIKWNLLNKKFSKVFRATLVFSASTMLVACGYGSMSVATVDNPSYSEVVSQEELSHIGLDDEETDSPIAETEQGNY